MVAMAVGLAVSMPVMMLLGGAVIEVALAGQRWQAAEVWSESGRGSGKGKLQSTCCWGGACGKARALVAMRARREGGGWMRTW